MRTTKQTSVDPLYVIFEEHLYNFSDADEDRKTFVLNVVKDYLGYMRKLNIVVPKVLEHQVVEELSAQVQTMLLKKTYGFLTIEEFQNKQAKPVKKRARTRYKKLTTQKSKSKKLA